MGGRDQVDFDPVKPGDNAMLILEADVLMPPEFFDAFDGVDIERIPYLDQEIKIEGWSPKTAEQKFLNRAISLGVRKWVD